MLANVMEILPKKKNAKSVNILVNVIEIFLETFEVKKL